VPLQAPNFVVIGAAKAGTTSLHGWLAQHPEIFVPRQKELHFFAADWLRENSKGPGDARVLQDLPPDWDAYLAHYEGAGAARAVGDVSPSYLVAPDAAGAIRARLGDPRIVLLLRDPVQKAFSQYTHLLRDGRETLTFWEGLQAEPERIGKGYGALWRYLAAAAYLEPTRRYLEAFGCERVKVILFDDLVRDPAAALRELFTFLGVDPGVAIDTSEVRNRSGAPRSPALAALVNHPTLRRLARSVLPVGLVAKAGSKLTTMNTGEKPLLDERSRDWLRVQLADDVRALEALLEQRTGWPA
jgi:hypothetical protein